MLDLMKPMKSPISEALIPEKPPRPQLVIGTSRRSLRLVSDVGRETRI